MSDDLVERLTEAYRLVAVWPEKSPDGFMHLLALRNMVPEAADAITVLTAERDDLLEACAKWAEVSQINFQRAKAAEDSLYKWFARVETAESNLARAVLERIDQAPTRDDVLEEAAKVAFTAATSHAPATERKKIASAIRAMKGTQHD